MDYILSQDVISEAKNTDLYGLGDKVISRLNRKDYERALSLCSEAKARCFEKSRYAGISDADKQQHSKNLARIVELEGLIERLVGK